jgi:beta-lactamase superfamily II metal-dependent hydrolase
MKKTTLLLFLFSCGLRTAFALEPQPDALFVRVVDVGAGLCCVIKTPDNHSIIYDAGYSAIKGITNLIPIHTTVDYLILSHTDADHIASVPKVCQNYKILNIVHPGLTRFNPTWQNAQAAIKKEVKKDHAREWNLAKKPLPPGEHFDLGGVSVTFVCGFSEPPADWDIDGESERYNAGSIVVRLSYKGKSILLCGDAVGRHLNDPETNCIATEKFMLAQLSTVPIASNVVIGPHHGSRGASSPAFILGVQPQDIIFSCGHKYSHPEKVAVQRYLSGGLTAAHIFRTDRGDNEGDKEWDSSTGSTADKSGDDDIDILITKQGKLTVAYRNN